MLSNETLDESIFYFIYTENVLSNVRQNVAAAALDTKQCDKSML